MGVVAGEVTALRRWRARAVDFVIGVPATRRLALTHAIDDFADSMINLSLVGSLFFSVSLEASQARILLYLVLTAAPLAIVAPAVGPMLDRSRAGYRTIMIGTQVTRAVIAVALVGSLLSLRFYPLVFGVLLSRKAYALVKTAMLAQAVHDRTELVAASGHIARTGTLAGGVGTAVAGVLILAVGVEWLPVVAAVFFLVAAGFAATIPAAPVAAPLTTTVRRPAEVPVDIRVASLAVAAIRSCSGALTFLLAFAIKRGGGDEWVFAAALLAAGLGTFLGTLIAPRLHRMMTSDRVVVLTLLGPGMVSLIGVLIIGSFGIVVIAFTIGLGVSISSRAMDGLYGMVPESQRGRVISQSELRFQLANLVGAALAVLLAPDPRIGFAAVAGVLILGGIAYASNRRLSIRREAGNLLLARPPADPSISVSAELMAEAQHAADSGRPRVAIVLAAAAVRTHPRAGSIELQDLAEQVERGEIEVTDEVAAAAIGDATRILDEELDALRGGA